MSWERQQAIIKRLHDSEAAVMAAEALAELDADTALGSVTSDQALLTERARQVGQGLIDTYKKQRRTGPVQRLIRGNSVRVEEFSEQKLQAVRKFRRIVTLEGVRTKPLTYATNYDHEDPEYMFDDGWVVGTYARKKIAGAQGTRPHTTEFGINERTVKIWNRTTERASGEADQEPVFTIACSNGEVTSFTNGVLDDRRRSIDKEAGAHALGLMIRTLELLDS